MPVEPGLIAYAGLALLAMASQRYRHAAAWLRRTSPGLTRSIGTALLLLSVIPAVIGSGPAQGIVAWIGQLCLAGTILVLLLSWRPRLAAMLIVPTTLGAIALMSANG